LPAPNQSEDGPLSSSCSSSPESFSPAASALPIENQKSKIENGSVPITPSLHSSHSSPDSHSVPSNGSLPKSALEEAVARLAKLSEVDYELVRRDEAKRLHLRVGALDDAVEAARLREDDVEAEKVGLSLIEPWPEPITDPPALFDEVHDRALLYFYLPAGAAVVLTMWPPHAHAIQAFTQTPRLNLTSIEAGSGKSTVLSFLATLCPKALRTDNLKTAVLFRIVERHQPTLLLDEVDTYVHLYSELRGLINAGHDPDACVHRIENHNIRAFRSFAATALAGLGHLSPTLRSRSIIIPMSIAPPGSLQLRFDKRKLEVENILGRKIARWTQDNFDAIAACDPPIPTFNRLADNWRSLFAVAQIIGGHWPQRILEAFHSLTTLTKVASDGSASSLLADIRTVFTQSGAVIMFSSVLVDSLCALPGRLWTTINRQKPITEIWLARRLRAFGIASHPLRINGARANGYALADFAETFASLLDGKSSGSPPPAENANPS
jgi:putative DNA primase/helicase